MMTMEYQHPLIHDVGDDLTVTFFQNLSYLFLNMVKLSSELS